MTPELEKDLEIINKSLEALRDHFDRQGKTFIIAYSLKTFENEDHAGYYENLISTSAKEDDYYTACARWAHMACDHVDTFRHGEHKPWRN